MRKISREYTYKGHDIVIMDLGGFYASYIKLVDIDVINTKWFSSWVDYVNNYVVVDDGHESDGEAARDATRHGLYVGHSYRMQSELDLSEIEFDTELAVERLIKIGL